MGQISRDICCGQKFVDIRLETVGAKKFEAQNYQVVFENENCPRNSLLKKRLNAVNTLPYLILVVHSKKSLRVQAVTLFHKKNVFLFFYQ